MSENTILLTTGERLGIRDNSTLKKAEEFLRVLQNKGSIKTLSDIAKTILCLNLACNVLSTPFDKETALKLSGLRKTLYVNNLRNLEKVLELDKTLSIAEVCVLLGCTVIKELAEEIYINYKKTDKKIKDLTHPQYIAASIYTACKLKKIKIQKSQIVEISRLKPSQWKELTEEFKNFADSIGLGDKSRKKINEDVIAELAEDIENKVVIKKKDQEIEEVEDYEVWKERILREAYAEMKKIKS